MLAETTKDLVNCQIILIIGVSILAIFTIYKISKEFKNNKK